MERKSERDLAQMRARAEQEMTSRDRQFRGDVNGLGMQHESYGKEVEASQGSYNAVQQAADEIRAKLATTSHQGQQYVPPLLSLSHTHLPSSLSMSDVK